MAAGESGESAVIGLVYRADWTRLSLAAMTADGSRVLLAPGRRYRYESPDHVTAATGADRGRSPATTRTV